MRRLAERAHRVVWLNPLLGRAGYEPQARGMATALPYVDDFLPIHDLRSLHELATRLGQIPRRKGAGGPARMRLSGCRDPQSPTEVQP
jgi:uncharacterized protein with von Willebrand factor type A (vWA) domain